MLRLFCYLMLLLGPVSCLYRGQPTGQVLKGHIYWQGEVRLSGDLILAKSAELTIAPGTRILFDPPAPGEDLYQEHPYFTGSELIVRGRLNARGTKENPIIFMAGDPAGNAGSWGGVNIEDSPGAFFKYCRFKQADSAIHARNSRVSIEYSTFKNNHVGVRFHDTRLRVENNLFENNGTAIRFHFGAPVIRNNLIQSNGKGLFISAEPRDYRIEGNSFIENRPYQVSLGEGLRKPVDLRNNYWSDSAGSDLEEFFFDGRVDDWLGRVVYRPVLERPGGNHKEAR